MTMLLALLVACGEKEETNTAAAEGGSVALADSIPADDASQAFAMQLIETDFAGFKPIDGGGAEFEYSRLEFMPDASWSANGAVTVADETMECTESGTWEMDPASSKEMATVGFTVGKTNCAGREEGAVTRIQIEFTKDGYDIKFR